MSDAARVRLFSWLSPAFPIGGFAFSQGLETAITDGIVGDAETLARWIEGALVAGSARVDAQILAVAYHAVRAADFVALAEANALTLALQASAERHAETREQARSFLAAAAAWPRDLPPALETLLAGELVLPVALGALSAHEGMALADVLIGVLNAWLAQQISVAVRLVPLGQHAGLKAQARLEGAVIAAAHNAETAAMKDIGGLAYGADIAAMRHETQTTRIFRS